LISFPNAKINLGLHVVAKRTDGYHNLETCFVPVNWCDILEIIEAPHTRFESSGISIPGDSKSNLCLQAYHLLRNHYDLPPVHIYLHKLIPIGAGLGGGSANASFTLKLLNNLFELNLSPARLEQYAARLGSDCPFFIKNEPVLAYGTGNEFYPVNVNLKLFTRK
jgi:4-diphosphocytidyl-2-C-methyl-D-erythritol kinase